MAYISLIELRSSNYIHYAPDWITLRVTKYSNQNNPVYTFNIPRQISTKAGIDVGTIVDIQYDPDRSIWRIQLTKDVYGFKVFAQKRTGKFSKNPPTRVMIAFPYIKDAKLPIIKKLIIIKEHEINNGIVMRIPDNKKEN